MKNNDVVNKLFSVGNELAMIWGGSCYELEIDHENESVLFHCIEYGEPFGVRLSFEKLRTEHGIEIA